MRLASFILISLLIVSTSAFAASKNKRLDAKAVLAFSQSVIGKTIKDSHFQNTDGQTVRISDFQGKPLVVSLVYTSCSYSCPLILTTLADAVDTARDALGKDSFNVITVGFDVVNDTPERMGVYESQYGIGGPNWTFLSTDQKTIRQFTNDLGFTFSPAPNGFSHLSQITILDKNGTVFRQVYGAQFATPVFVDPLKNLVFGTDEPYANLDNLIKKVRLFCTIYDPETSQYRFNYALFIQIFVGFIMILGMATFVVSSSWSIYKRNRG